MSIDLRLGSYVNSKGEMNVTSELTAFKISKIRIHQRYHDGDNDEVFDILLTEKDGREHRIKLYCTDQNTEIELAPDADRRLNGIPRRNVRNGVDELTPEETRNLVKTTCKEKGVSMRKLSLTVGKNPAYIQQFIEKGAPKRFPFVTAVQIADVLGLPVYTFVSKRIKDTIRKGEGGNSIGEAAVNGIKNAKRGSIVDMVVPAAM